MAGLVSQLFQVEELPRLTLADLKAAERAERQAELGVPGTINQSGRLHVEVNSDLQWEKAYGSPGVITWGEWELLAKTDPAIATALEMISAPIREAEVGVEPAGEDAQSIKIADFVRDNLTEWMEPLWAEFVLQALSCIPVGFSLFETVFCTRPDERVPGGKALVLSKLAQRLASSIKSDGWKEGPDGELETVVQAGYRGGRWIGDIALPVNRLLLFTWNRQGNNYQGTSALRSGWYLAKIRELLAKLMAIGHEREALGTPVATQGPNAAMSPAQMDELQTFLENLRAHEKTAIVLPKDVEINWVFAEGAATKGRIIDTYNQLGKTLQELLFSQQAYLGTSDTGSRAVGSVHVDAKTQFVKGIKTGLEAILNGVGNRPYTGLVGRLVTPNFGDQRRLPKVKLALQRPEVSIGEVATAVPALVACRALTMRLEDENKLRERLGFTPIDEEERTANEVKDVDADDEAGAELEPGADVEAVKPTTGEEVDPSTALNGAQVAALVAVVTAVAKGELPRETGVAIITASFPVSAEQAETIMGSVGNGFTPEPPADIVSDRERGADDVKDAPEDGEGDAKRPLASSTRHAGHRVVPDKKRRPGASRREPPASTRLSDFTPKRPLKLEEQHLYLAEMSSFLDRSREEFEQDAQDLVTEMVARAIPDIRAAMADGDPSELLGLQMDESRLASYVEAFIERARAEGYRHVRSELKRQPTGLLHKRAAGNLAFASEEERDDASPATTPDEPEASPVYESERKVRKLVDAMRDRLLQRMRARVIDDVVAEATYVARAGGDPADVVDRVVQRALDTRGLRQDAGSVLTTAFNVGREQYAQERGDLVQAVQYSAVLDAGVCKFCEADDGKQFDFNSDEHHELVPPHPDCEGRDNCRCLLVYLEEKTVTEIPEP